VFVNNELLDYVLVQKHRKLFPPYFFTVYHQSVVWSDVTIPSTISLYNNLDISIRNPPSLSLFNNRMKDDTYKTSEYYNEDPRKLNILHNILRHQYSSLNADLSSIHNYIKWL